MTLPMRLWVGLAVVAGLFLVIAANGQFVHLAVTSQPGCVAVDPARPAAKPGC